MRLSKSTKDAIAILVHLARREDDSTMSIPQIADACGLTPAVTFKLVPVLVRAGYLVSGRGRSGGVRLARAPGDIPVGEVVRTLEQTPQTDLNTVEAGTDLEAMIGDAFEAFVSILDQNTVADLAGPSGATDVTRRLGNG